MVWWRDDDYDDHHLSPGALAGIGAYIMGDSDTGIGVSVFGIIVIIIVGMFIARYRSRPFTPYIKPSAQPYVQQASYGQQYPGYYPPNVYPYPPQSAQPYQANYPPTQQNYNGTYVPPYSPPSGPYAPPDHPPPGHYAPPDDPPPALEEPAMPPPAHK